MAEKSDIALDAAGLQKIEPDRARLNQALRTLRREIIAKREDDRFAINVPLVREYVRSQSLV